MFLAAVLVGALATGAYWFRRRQTLPDGRWPLRSFRLPVLLLAGLGVLIAADRINRDQTGGGKPVFVAMAVDLSLSMGAAPGPGSNVGTRMQRARQTLLEVLDTLDATGSQVMVSITGFTTTSQPILVWDDNLAQVREVVEHVLAPGLLTKPGSELGGALKGAIPLFDNLPEVYRSESAERFLIVVSDGEQTEEGTDIAAELAELRTRGVGTVALQVGSLDEREGLPIYDEQGGFMGFREVGGEFYSIPDPEIMSLIAGSDPNAGRYVRAEGADAAAEISEFIGVHRQSNPSDLLYLGISMALWSVALMLLLWFI